MYWTATKTGWHSGGRVRKVKKETAPLYGMLRFQVPLHQQHAWCEDAIGTPDKSSRPTGNNEMAVYSYRDSYASRERMKGVVPVRPHTVPLPASPSGGGLRRTGLQITHCAPLPYTAMYKGVPQIRWREYHLTGKLVRFAAFYFRCRRHTRAQSTARNTPCSLMTPSTPPRPRPPRLPLCLPLRLPPRLL